MSFIRDLILKQPMSREEMRFPVFPVRAIGERIAAAKADEPKVLRPTYSYDLAEIDALRSDELRRLDELGKEKVRQMMAQLIPGVCYETGTTTENHSTFVWARPVRVHPDYAPHVIAWARVLTAGINQP